MVNSVDQYFTHFSARQGNRQQHIKGVLPHALLGRDGCAANAHQPDNHSIIATRRKRKMRKAAARAPPASPLLRQKVPAYAPPSASTFCPVMYAACALHKNAQMAPNSCAVP